MTTGLQIVGLLFGLIMCYFTFLYYKRKEYERRDYVFWMAIWVGFIGITIFPYLLSDIGRPLGIPSMMQLFTIVALTVAFSIIFYQHDLLRKNDKRLRELIREIALNSAKRTEKAVD